MTDARGETALMKLFCSIGSEKINFEKDAFMQLLKKEMGL